MIMRDRTMGELSLKKSERNKQIFDLRSRGMTLKEIAYKYGISPSRVYEIYCIEKKKPKITNGEDGSNYTVSQVGDKTRPWILTRNL